MLSRPVGSDMCEQDSTVSIHFCLLEILMLWWIYDLSFFICGSEREEEQRASLSIMSRLSDSVRLGIMTLVAEMTFS